MTDATSIRYEEPAPRVARIVLARPESRNADPSFLSRQKEIAARW
jgi:1,4-dihydroxy-2-naphthoyl-CoA synthase